MSEIIFAITLGIVAVSATSAFILIMMRMIFEKTFDAIDRKIADQIKGDKNG